MRRKKPVVPEITAEERAFFAKYRDHRARYRPDKCTGKGRCWVENGPPSYDAVIGCIECEKSPRAIPKE